MNDPTKKANLKDKVEMFLDRACQAEAEGDYPEAERQFRFAVYCEGLSRSDVTSAKEYVQQVGPVYADNQRPLEPAIREENHAKRIEG